MCLYHKTVYRIVIIILLLASLSACLVGPNFKPNVIPTVKYYTAAPWLYHTGSAIGFAGSAQRFVVGKRVLPEWWREFHSKKLNQLVYRGICNSPNLLAAKAVLREAEENLNAQIGDLYPSFSAQLAVQRGSRAAIFDPNTMSDAVGGNSKFSGNIFNLFNASVNISYLLDIFGGMRREIEVLKARVDYQAYETEAAYLSLIGNIVNSTITLASLQTQIVVTKQLIVDQQHRLHIIQQQFKLGAIASTDVLAQQTQVAQTRATLPILEKNAAQTDHALAVLVGSLPSCGHIPDIRLNELHLPVQLPLSIPSVLVRHRPDIRAAEALRKAANAQIGVATANVYPQFSINSTYGLSNSAANKLFSAQSTLWSVGSGLLQPLFKGGALLAQRRAAYAAYDQAEAHYRQVLLQAFKNVADTLRALEADARELRAQKQAEVAAWANLNLARQKYKLGSINYLSLLDAQRQYRQIRIYVIRAQTRRYTDTVALYQALGGGLGKCINF